MKNNVLAIITVTLSLTLTACGSSSNMNTAPKTEKQEETETAVQSDAEEQVEEIVSEPVVLTEFDDLQSIFCALSYNTTTEDVEAMIAERGLEYTAEEYNSNKLTYKIARSADVAKQSHAKEGDNVEITFTQDEGTFLYAKYFNVDAFKDAVLYSYGTYWDFREDASNNTYSGYYYHSPGDTQGGITIEYSNGNSKKTGYHPCNSAEEAVSYAVTTE